MTNCPDDLTLFFKSLLVSRQDLMSLFYYTFWKIEKVTCTLKVMVWKRIASFNYGDVCCPFSLISGEY